MFRLSRTERDRVDRGGGGDRRIVLRADRGGDTARLRTAPGPARQLSSLPPMGSSNSPSAIASGCTSARR